MAITTDTSEQGQKEESLKTAYANLETLVPGEVTTIVISTRNGFPAKSGE